MASTDFLVIGSGVAGFTYAIKLAERFPEKQITVITKSKTLESNTRYAQGGIAVVTDTNSDSFERHIEDTLIAGDGLCNPNVVRAIVTEGPERIKEVADWGTHFDFQDGHVALGREGGHTANRIIHRGDKTGKELSNVLLSRVKGLSNIQLLKGHMVLELMMNHAGACCGVIIAGATGRVSIIQSPTTVLATGGIGQVYAYTTNPSIATGDGLAMAHRAGATVSGMEFIQFHPTALYHPDLKGPFLISEAVRGAGARLKNSLGEYFMEKYHAQKDLAPRDIVSRAVFAEMERTGADCVFLDCSNIDKHEMKTHFPTISKKCAELGINLQTDAIPVKPAAHYLCGGIDTDLNGATSVPNLYAIGECANTGLHGANRLASNSLLEALVMAHRCYLTTSLVPAKREAQPYETVLSIGTELLQPLRDELRNKMEANAGILRTTAKLESVLLRLKELSTVVESSLQKGELSVEGYELRNMIAVSTLIVQQSLHRKANVGGYFNTDLLTANQLSQANHSA
ncbi:MAG: L-aspartate oxidase [Flavobacteriales bacterium]|nr:L-aspartate oxidase [Flavobacteriales bacterium]